MWWITQCCWGFGQHPVVQESSKRCQKLGSATYGLVSWCSYCWICLQRFGRCSLWRVCVVRVSCKSASASYERALPWCLSNEKVDDSFLCSRKDVVGGCFWSHFFLQCVSVETDFCFSVTRLKSSESKYWFCFVNILVFSFLKVCCHSYPICHLLNMHVCVYKIDNLYI